MVEIIGNDMELKRMYKEFNESYFNNELPKYVDVEWSSRLTSNAGIHKKKINYVTNEVEEIIRLSTHYHKKNPQDIIDTLVHEMVHVKYPRDKHGSKFINEMKRLNREYGLNIRVYSSERALVKYKYICKECGKTYDRSRRLGSGYRCGVCRGGLVEEVM